MKSIEFDRPRAHGLAFLRVAGRLIHTAPEHSTVTLLGRDAHPRVACISPRAEPPYYVFEDGSTEPAVGADHMAAWAKSQER